MSVRRRESNNSVYLYISRKRGERRKKIYEKKLTARINYIVVVGKVVGSVEKGCIHTCGRTRVARYPCGWIC